MESDNEKKCQVVAVLSGKGGSGKTTASLGIGKLLGDIGLRVLLVDFDLATSGASYFFAPRLSDESRLGIVEVLDGSHGGIPSEVAADKPLDSLAVEIGTGFAFVPSRTHLGARRDEFLQDDKWYKGSEALLRDLISQACGKYDVVLIDTQAGYSRTSAAAARSAQRAIVVSESDRISSEAVDNLVAQLGEHLPLFRRYLINKVEIKEAGMYQSIAAAFRNMNRLPPLPFDFDVRRAFGDRVIPIDLDKPTPFLIALFATLKEAFPDWREQLQRYENEKISTLFDRYQNELESVIEERDKARERLHEIEFADKYRELSRTRLTASMLAALSLTIFAGFGYTVYFARDWFGSLSFEKMAVLMAALIAAVVPLSSMLWYRSLRDQLAREKVESSDEAALRSKVTDSDREIERYRNLIAVRAKEYLIDFKPTEIGQTEASFLERAGDRPQR